MRSELNSYLKRWAGFAMSVCIVSIVTSAVARDWPQFRGPEFNGVSRDRIVKDWIGAVTNPVWRILPGNGLGSVAVISGRVFTQVERPVTGTNRELCLALNAADGRELWATPVDIADYPDGGVGFDDGPRTTPAVDGDSVYVLTAYLKLFRLNVTNGAVIWQRDLPAEYGGTVIKFQNSASPLLDSGMIYLNCGTNRDGRSLAALRATDGSEVWRVENEAMTHSAPALATIHGVRQLIFATQSGLIALNPETGERLWKFAYPFVYETCIGVSPVVWDDLVFITGAHAYGQRSVTVKVSLSNETFTAAQHWMTNLITSHWMTPVVHEGFLYGLFGIQTFDSPNAQLKCIDLRTGAQKWSTNGFGRGGVTLVDGHLLTLAENGRLVLSRLNTNAYSEVARFVAIPGYNGNTNKCWNVPAIADGRVFVRSTSFAGCFDLSLPDLAVAGLQFIDGHRLQFAVGTATGTPLSSNRLAQVEVRASASLDVPLANWTILTNRPRQNDGVVEIESTNTNHSARYYIVSEPQ